MCRSEQSFRLILDAASVTLLTNQVLDVDSFVGDLQNVVFVHLLGLAIGVLDVRFALEEREASL